MDLEYFKEHIEEEIEGAKDYIIRAIEMKPMDPAWTRKLTEMSMQELGHAEALHNMFNEYYKQLQANYKQMPEYVDKIKSEIAERYATGYAEVKMMHEAVAK